MLAAGGSLTGGVGAVLTLLLIVFFVWAAWVYLRGPHDLARLVRVGDAPTPPVAWRGQVFAGLCLVRVAYAYLIESPEGDSPLLYGVAFLGVLLIGRGLWDGLSRARHSA